MFWLADEQIERLRPLVPKSEEASIRIALNDAAPFYRDAPEAAENHAESAHIVHAFLLESAPHADDTQCSLAGDLIKTTLSAVGSSLSAVPRTLEEIHAYADPLADMLCACLERLAEVPLDQTRDWFETSRRGTGRRIV